MKKIGFVTPWYGENIPGGAEAELRGLVTHLFAAGVELEILTTCVKEFASDWNTDFYRKGPDTAGGTPVRRFPVRRRDTAAFDAVNLKLMKKMPVTREEEETYRREMVNSPALYEYMAAHSDEYALFVFIPYMFGTTVNGIAVCPEKSVLIPCLHDESYAYMGIFKELFPKLRGMIFHSQPESELAHRLYGLENVAAVTLGEGVDTQLAGSRERFAEKYGIQSPFILYAGRKDSGKKVDMLIRCFVEYKKRQQTDLKLVLIGGGQIGIPQTMKGEIIDLGFVPKQDKYDAYAAAALLCQPSANESFSLVIMESWLCGRPVLVNARCLVTRNFASVSNGGLYFESYPEFEGCVNFLLTHPETAGRMGELGREYVLSHFAWDVIVKTYTEYFEGLTGERS